MGNDADKPLGERYADVRWRADLGATDEVLVLIDADFRIRYSNQPAGDGSDAIGTPALAWLKPEYHERVRAAAARAHETGLPQHYETESIRPDGTGGWYSCWISDVTRGEADTVFAITAHDITQRRRAETAMREQESKLRAIVSNSQAIIYLVDTDGTISLSEGRQLSALGLAPGQLVGQNAFELYRDNPAAMRGLEEPLAGRDFHEVVPVGDRFFDTITSPYRAADGALLGMVGMAVDVTERERALVALRESEERYRGLVEYSPEAIVVLDPERAIFVEANEAAERLFGMSHAELMRVGPAEVSVDQQPDGRPSAEAAAEHMGAAIAHGQTQFEWMHCHASGRPIPCTVWLSKLPSADRLLLQGNVTDQTARKAAEAERARLATQLQQASKMQAIGQLTGGVAHDFNNLLTVIMGNLELVRMAGADEADGTGNLLDSALEAAQRGSSLTHRLLAFSRKQPLQPKRVELNRLIAGMEDLLRRTLGETIAIEIVSAAGLWACEADPTQLENVVLNLAINSRDAMPRGGKLTIEAGNARLDADYADDHDEVVAGQYVMLAVTDTGTGMLAEVLANVFEPFFTTKGVGEGSGLGLSMVYGFTKQSGGHVKIYSEPDEGTTVRIYLPRAAADAVTPDPRPVPGRNPAGGGELVLVVEDDPRVRELSVALLDRLGYRTVAAATGAEGLALLEANPEVQLLFTDVVLPDGMSGVELAVAAQERRPGLKVLFTSGYTENAIIHHGRLDAGVELLEKPFTLKQLARRVREVLDG